MNLEWRSWSPSQWTLRAVVLLGTMLAYYARGLTSGGTPPGWVAAAVFLLAAGWALFPESVVGVVALVVVGWTWAADIPTGVPSAALLAAAGMLAAHLAALVIGYGPPRLRLAPGVVQLWTVRGAVAFVSSLLVWAMSRGVRELPDSGTVWVLGLGLAVSVLVVAVAVVQALTPQGQDS